MVVAVAAAAAAAEISRKGTDRTVFLKPTSVSFFHFSLMKQLRAIQCWSAVAYIYIASLSGCLVAAAAAAAAFPMSSTTTAIPFSFLRIHLVVHVLLLLLFLFLFSLFFLSFQLVRCTYGCDDGCCCCCCFQYLSYKPLIPSTNTSSVNTTLSTIHFSQCHAMRCIAYKLSPIRRDRVGVMREVS